MANLVCPQCGGSNVEVSLQQENHGSTTITKSKSKTKSGHGCFWWVLIGWWWILIDACLWVLIFPIRLCIQLFKRKKSVTKGTSVTQEVANIEYKSVCLCKDCGHNWVK